MCVCVCVCVSVCVCVCVCVCFCLCLRGNLLKGPALYPNTEIDVEESDCPPLNMAHIEAFDCRSFVAAWLSTSMLLSLIHI